MGVCVYFSPDLMKTKVLELNASDERGIQVSDLGLLIRCLVKQEWKLNHL